MLVSIREIREAVHVHVLIIMFGVCWIRPLSVTMQVLSTVEVMQMFTSSSINLSSSVWLLEATLWYIVTLSSLRLLCGCWKPHYGSDTLFPQITAGIQRNMKPHCLSAGYSSGLLTPLSHLG